MALTNGDKAYLGSISVKVQTPEFAVRGRENIREFRRQMREAHEQGIEEGRDILQDVLYDRQIFDTENLIESVASKLFNRTSDIFSGTVHFNNPAKEYAYFVEHGRGEGLPPPMDPGQPFQYCKVKRIDFLHHKYKLYRHSFRQQS